MVIETVDGWKEDHDDSVSEDELIEMVEAALTKVVAKCKQPAMLEMSGIALHEAYKVKISKGLHQEEGSMISEKHVTLDQPIWPAPKRFHLYFMKIAQGRGKKRSWVFLPSRLTHRSGGVTSSYSF